jgi:hypothetical protein
LPSFKRSFVCALEMKKASIGWLFCGLCADAQSGGFKSAKKLGFLGVGIAPAGAGHFLASKQRATASCVSGFALVQSAVAALLASRILGVFDFGRVSGVGQSRGLWVFFVHHGLSHGLGCGQGSAAQSDLHHENAAVGLFHKNSSKVGNKLTGAY